MRRFALIFLAAAAGAACAPMAASGVYSPRPFPRAPMPPAPRQAPAADSTVAAPQPSGPAGPALSGERATATAALLTTAMGLTGVPYRLGGADPSGFDCSGFVQYVLRQHQVAMPRTVVEQFDVGASVPLIEPGDLVFFQTDGSQASHVGIAIDGQSFVHAPNSRGVVRVERLDAPYWAERFIGARRVF